jgi:integrase
VAVQGTKTDRDYGVALDAGTAAVLEQHRRAAERQAEAFGARLSPESFVFSFEPDSSRPWRPDLVTHRWARYRKRAGLDGVRLHDVRHFMATTMLRSGVPVSVVSGRLGHSRAPTTLNVYSHFIEGDDRGAADVLGAALAPDTANPPDSDRIHGQAMGNGTSHAERPHR